MNYFSKFESQDSSKCKHKLNQSQTQKRNQIRINKSGNNRFNNNLESHSFSGPKGTNQQHIKVYKQDLNELIIQNHFLISKINIANQINKGADIATDAGYQLINKLSLKDQTKDNSGRVLDIANRFTKDMAYSGSLHNANKIQPETLHDSNKIPPQQLQQTAKQQRQIRLRSGWERFKSGFKAVFKPIASFGANLLNFIPGVGPILSAGAKGLIGLMK